MFISYAQIQKKHLLSYTDTRKPISEILEILCTDVWIIYHISFFVSFFFFFLLYRFNLSSLHFSQAFSQINQTTSNFSSKQWIRCPLLLTKDLIIVCCGFLSWSIIKTSSTYSHLSLILFDYRYILTNAKEWLPLVLLIAC